ncbi:SemiSWEET transporter [Candidatus Roizmanbacteria bacterium]|nr:SemiSWEET transporter [Candidatus Roizmanbacteria bacterium]
MNIQFLGLLAGGLVIVASLPQILSIIKTKSTKDISLPMYIILNTGVALWVVFGLITHSLAVTITNGIYLIFTLIILFLKIKHG